MTVPACRRFMQSSRFRTASISSIMASNSSVAWYTNDVTRGNVVAALAALRRSQAAFATLAEQTMRVGPGRKVDSSSNTSLAACLAVQAARNSLLAARAPAHQLQAACQAVGLLLAFQDYAQMQPEANRLLTQLLQLTLASLVDLALFTGGKAVHNVPSVKDSNAAVVAGITCSYIITSSWAQVLNVSSSTQACIQALVSTALLACMQCKLQTEQDQMCRAVATHNRLVQAAFSAMAQHASALADLRVTLHTMFIAAASVASHSACVHDPDASQQAAIANMQHQTTQLLWQLLHTAQQLSATRQARALGATDDPHKEAASHSKHSLQDFTAAILLACSLVHDPMSQQPAPQLAALLSSAQAVLQQSRSAAASLLLCVLPEGAHVHSEPRTLQSAPPNQWQQLLHEGLQASSLQAPELRSIASALPASVRHRSASFLLVLAAPHLPAAVQDEGGLRSSVLHAQPVLCNMAASHDARMRRTALDFVVALLVNVGAGAHWLKVLVLQWWSSLLAAYPDAHEKPGELETFMRSLVVSGAAPEVLLACCQVTADRGHSLTREDSSADAMQQIESTDDHVQPVQDVVGCLMAAIVWGPVKCLGALLQMLQDLWRSTAGREAADVANVIMQHLVHCHDHRKKPTCVRWYHEQVQQRYRSKL